MLGRVLSTMVTGEEPWDVLEGATEQELLQQMGSHVLPLPADTKPHLRRLIASAWGPSPRTAVVPRTSSCLCTSILRPSKWACSMPWGWWLPHSGWWAGAIGVQSFALTVSAG